MVSVVSLTFVIVLALLPLLTWAFTYRVKTCSAYKASKSNNALTKYCTCTVKLCPNQYASIDSCGKCSGTQYLRLYAPNNTQVAQSNGLSSTCSPCGRISNFRPTFTTKCQTYKLREGCAGTGTCSATVKIFVANTTIPSNYTSVTVQAVSHSSPFVSLQSLLSGDIYEEETVEEEDHPDDWQVEEVPDVDEADPHALETAIRYHNLNKAKSLAKPEPETETQEQFDEEAFEDADVDEAHRRLLGSPTRSPSRSPSRSPTRRPTTAAAASGYCMTKKKASKMAVIVGVIIPVVFVLFAIGIAVLRRYQRNKNVSVAPGVQMMPQPAYGSQPQPMMMGQQQTMMLNQGQPMMMGQPQPGVYGGQPQPMMMGQPQPMMGQPQTMMLGQGQPMMMSPGQPQPMMIGQTQPGMYPSQGQPMMIGQGQPMMMGQPMMVAQPVGYAPVGGQAF